MCTSAPNKLVIFSRISSALRFNDTITVHRVQREIIPICFHRSNCIENAVRSVYISFFFFSLVHYWIAIITMDIAVRTVFSARYWLCNFSDQSNPCIWFTLPCLVQFHFGYYNSRPLNLLNQQSAIIIIPFPRSPPCPRTHTFSALSLASAPHLFRAFVRPFSLIYEPKQTIWRKQFLRKMKYVYTLCIVQCLDRFGYYTNPDNIDNWIVIVRTHVRCAALIGSHISYCIFDMGFFFFVRVCITSFLSVRVNLPKKYTIKCHSNNESA